MVGSGQHVHCVRTSELVRKRSAGCVVESAFALESVLTVVRLYCLFSQSGPLRRLGRAAVHFDERCSDVAGAQGQQLDAHNMAPTIDLKFTI